MSAVVERICELPRTFHDGGGSPISIVQASGYLERAEELTRTAVVGYLRDHPELIEAWEGWSDVQRSSSAWVFNNDGPRPRVWHFPTGPQMVFDDPAEACAEFILRHVEHFKTYK